MRGALRCSLPNHHRVWVLFLLQGENKKENFPFFLLSLMPDFSLCQLGLAEKNMMAQGRVVGGLGRLILQFILSGGGERI